MTNSHSDAGRLPLVAPFDMVVFGGTGDLAMRKLMPALLRRDIDGQIDPRSRIIGIGRSPIENPAYARRVEAGCRKALDEGLTEQSWSRFARHLRYLALDALNPDHYSRLHGLLDTDDAEPHQRGTALGLKSALAEHIRVFYLATDPILFGPLSGVVRIRAREPTNSCRAGKADWA